MFTLTPTPNSKAQCAIPAMVRLEKLAPQSGAEDPDMPRQRSISVFDAGMGDLLRFDAERLRVLIERAINFIPGNARQRAKDAAGELGPKPSNIFQGGQADADGCSMPPRAHPEMKNERAPASGGG